MAETSHATPAQLPPAPIEVSRLFERAGDPVDFTDLHAIAGAAHRVPFISRDDWIDGTDFRQHSVETEYVRDVTVPMDRIVGVHSMANWAGRGLRDGIVVAKDGHSSLASIAYYGTRPQSDEYSSGAGAPHVALFTDTDDEVWAMGANDGSHRIAAAKLRGDAELLHADVTTAPILPRVNFSVAELLARRQQKNNSRIGGFMLTFAALELADKSVALDIEYAREQSEIHDALAAGNGSMWI